MDNGLMGVAMALPPSVSGGGSGRPVGRLHLRSGNGSFPGVVASAPAGVLAAEGSPDPVTRGAFPYPSPADYVRIQAEDIGTEELTIDEALGDAVRFGASDAIIKADSPVWYAVNGVKFPSDRFHWPKGQDMYDLAQGMVDHTVWTGFVQNLELDASYVIRTGDYAGARFRVNVMKSDDDCVEIVCRYINPNFETAAALGLPDRFMEWSRRPRGLVLVCGPTGSGKSTSLATAIRDIQLHRPIHILTVESPVETVYPHDGMAVVSQREVGLDTLSFGNALTSAMRNAPDVILVGEMRTAEEISATIEAADTGHLTFSTLHTKSAEESILRIVSKFEGPDKQDVLTRLSSNLVGIMSQQLLQRRDGNGRIAVHETLEVNRDVSELILNGDVHGIHDYMMEKKISMDHRLLLMVVRGDITYREALGHAMNRADFITLAMQPKVRMHIPELSE